MISSIFFRLDVESSQALTTRLDRNRTRHDRYPDLDAAGIKTAASTTRAWHHRAMACEYERRIQTSTHRSASSSPLTQSADRRTRYRGGEKSNQSRQADRETRGCGRAVYPGQAQALRVRQARGRRSGAAIDWLLDHRMTPDDQMVGLHFGEAGVAVAIAEAVARGWWRQARGSIYAAKQDRPTSNQHTATESLQAPDCLRRPHPHRNAEWR
jgi:hypothetical protein